MHHTGRSLRLQLGIGALKLSPVSCAVQGQYREEPDSRFMQNSAAEVVHRDQMQLNA